MVLHGQRLQKRNPLFNAALRLFPQDASIIANNASTDMIE